MDDDIFVSCASLERLIQEYNKDSFRIVGVCGRNLSKDYAYEAIEVYGDVDIILTRLLLMERRLCSLFFYCKPMIENIYKKGKPYGNGEDIFMSFIASIYYKKKNYCVPYIDYRNLSEEYAISFSTDHISYRTKFCRYLKTIKVEVVKMISGLSFPLHP